VGISAAGEESMSYKAVVFDMDGTLLDTLEDLANAMNRVLAKRGFPVHPVNAFRYFVGSGARELVRRVLPENTAGEERTACLADFLHEYENGWNVQTKLYEGMAELLDALTRMGLPMAVLTNKPQDFAVLCMRHYLSAWKFAVTLGQGPAVPPKPDPAGPNQIIASLGVRAGEILYLGDTDVDMRTAVGAGMFPVGVLWGFRDREELLAAGAAALIAHPLGLLDLLA
jgi:phosphoglycolate phosphatase